jgi:hypothetical protein
MMNIGYFGSFSIAFVVFYDFCNASSSFMSIILANGIESGLGTTLCAIFALCND